MRLILTLLFAAAVASSVAPPAAYAREVVDASAAQSVSVTVYRDPERGAEDEMNRDWPQGFAMISEVRQVTLPAGQSTIRFTGVAEGMVAVSAIVTGLPGGINEKNRNADLLSPAALVNGMLGNRITITRTNPATGAPQSESAVVRTRADGGLVLQTAQGYEAVRCAGLPETLTFPAVPDGLSPQPVFTIDTHDTKGGTYTVTLTYIAWGFDWQAHYVATLDEGRGNDSKVEMRLLSWLTILNDNGQSFADAQLMAVAGRLNIESDFEALSDPPQAAPLQLTCYPIGSTAAGSPLFVPPPPSMAASSPEMEGYDSIIVTGQKRSEALMDVPLAVTAIGMEALEEQLGDLKLYRVPEPVSVNAQGLKQVAFLNRHEVKGQFLYRARCEAYDAFDLIEDPSDMEATEVLLVTKNDKEHGLGVAMPMGGFTVFEPSPAGDLLVGEEFLRDYAVGQDVEVGLGESGQVFSECAATGGQDPGPAGDGAKAPWVAMKALLSNANPGKVRVRLVLGWASEWEVRGLKGVRLKDGNRVVEVDVPANGRKEMSFKVRRIN